MDASMFLSDYNETRFLYSAFISGYIILMTGMKVWCGMRNMIMVED